MGTAACKLFIMALIRFLPSWLVCSVYSRLTAAAASVRLCYAHVCVRVRVAACEILWPSCREAQI